jgi:hypothetical protein
MTIPRYDVRVAHTDFVDGSVEALRRMFEHAQAIDLRASEPDKSEIAHESLLRAIVPLLDEAYAVICRVATRFEEAAENDPLRMDVADIAALAGMALQERRNLLTHLQPCDHWTYLENCERSLRSLRKSVSVVEGALTRYGHLPTRVDRAADLECALRVRRRYATLRREIARASAQQLDIQPRLRAVSRSIAALLSCDEYPSMRLGDRRELRMLQFRVQSWLSAEYPSDTLGERTWEEVIAVVNLLSGVNRRSELMAHDADIVEALAAVARSTQDVRTLRAAAVPLFGMDPELDLLLDIHVPESHDRECWQQVIAQLAAEREIAETTRPESEQPAHSSAP